jgi:uncharacterized protein (TIGR03000 family)
MKLILTGGCAILTVVLAAARCSAQDYPHYPYLYKPGNAGVMGIGPGGREAYRPDYYSTVPHYGYGFGFYGGYGGYGYGPANYTPNITGLPSVPMANPDEAISPSRSRAVSVSVSHPNAAAIDVKVPAGARLLVQGQPTRQTGANRFFESPPLEQGKTYAYKIKAMWTNKDGEKVERDRTVQVRAGSHVAVDLRKPSSENAQTQ